MAGVVILGGGFGGLATANELRRLLPPEVPITVVDRRRDFTMGLAYLWVMVGRRRPPEGQGDRGALERKGIRFLQTEVEAIDPRARRVVTGLGPLEADHLVIALGADVDPTAVPGFGGVGHTFYTLEGAVALGQVLETFRGGRLVVAIFGLPFKCPPAPYEGALLLEEYVRRRGLGGTEVHLLTPEPHPLPILGPAVGARVRALLEAKGIHYHPGRQPASVDPGARALVMGDGTREAFDLLVGVPPHRPPRVVRDAGLVDASGWIPVDPHTLETAYPGVYALGDVAGTRLPGGALLPRAGILAEGQGIVVARNIAARVAGAKPPAAFDGRGYCFLEVGGGRATLVRADFFRHGGPSATLEEPSEEALEAKRQFEAERLLHWF